MRYLDSFIKKDLEKKMVFLSGPRQVGKTTLAQGLLSKTHSGKYYNWDRFKDQKSILAEDWDDREGLIVLDEIHKYPKWKNFLKGCYDTQKQIHQFLITGSARLNVYRRGGDSLLGRYHHWTLHPFSLDEKINHKISPEETFKRLLRVGGFPEVFFDNNEREARRWREERYERIIRDDIRDLEEVKQISQMSILLAFLRERVGGEIVASNLARDIQVSVPTVIKWLEIFERMYLVFIVRAHTGNLARAISKPVKVYFFDNADVEGDEGAKFENFIASHLIKRCHFLHDYTGEKWELCYLRDREKREIDFALICDKKVEEIIEVKWHENHLSPSLSYFAERLNPKKAIQLVGNKCDSLKKGKLHRMNVFEYFKNPPWYR